MTAPAPTRTARLALAVAMILIAAGWIVSGGEGVDFARAPAPRVVLVRVPDLSWGRVAAAIRDGRMPALGRIVRGAAAVGDLDARGYGGDAPLLASIVTGQFPFQHGVRGGADLVRFETGTDTGPRPFWAWLAARGSRCAVLGFPPGTPVREEPRDLLREDPERHLFLSFERSGPIRAGLSDEPDDLVALDRALDQWTEAAGAHTTFFLVSERGATPAGFFLAWGRGVRRSIETHTVTPVDLAATLIYLSGQPLPQDLDGAVLLEILDESYAIRHRRIFRP